MPQCVAQQDQSAWLRVMSSCTGRQCTRHFGVICTHHQWLTQLSCLSTGFTPDLVREYLAYCSRSVLAEAQLYQWIHAITGRPWLADVGDASALQRLSPASLTRGYAAVDIIDKAPTCLTESVLASSLESFDSFVASCGFTSGARHTGNAARPWEYSESQRSMVALDTETAGYELTQHSIAYGDYFDKWCFCEAFRTERRVEPCSRSELGLTKERMWLNVTCGLTALPDNWTHGLKTTPYAYIPTRDWRWPSCFSTVPEKVIDLAGRCTTDACEPDSGGYCAVRRAVDRACFCRDIQYDTCKGKCHIFEDRIDYVQWLHDLCGSEEGWHGLPKYWRQLASLTPQDLIPWQWNMGPKKRAESSSIEHPMSSSTTISCGSTDWTMKSLVLINMATLLAGIFGRGEGSKLIARARTRYLSPRSWFLPGLVILTLHLLANWMNAVLVQSTTSYEDVPVVELVLFWCSLPRFTWMTVWIVSMQSFSPTTFYMAASHLFAESLLQAASASYIISTINYGREHSFYSNAMSRLQKFPSARYMYAGALMWLIVMIIALVLLLQTMWNTRASLDDTDTHKSTLRSVPQPAKLFADLTGPINQYWTQIEEKLTRHWTDKAWEFSNAAPSNHSSSTPCTYTVYGTLPTYTPHGRSLQKDKVRLTLIVLLSLPLLWIAQWLFWAGFLGLAMERYVFLRVLWLE